MITGAFRAGPSTAVQVSSPPTFLGRWGLARDGVLTVDGIEITVQPGETKIVGPFGTEDGLRLEYEMSPHLVLWVYECPPTLARLPDIYRLGPAPGWVSITCRRCDTPVREPHNLSRGHCGPCDDRIQVGVRSGHVLMLEAPDGSITCLACWSTMRQPADVADRYCGHCHIRIGVKVRERTDRG